MKKWNVDKIYLNNLNINMTARNPIINAKSMIIIFVILNNWESSLTTWLLLELLTADRLVELLFKLALFDASELTTPLLPEDWLEPLPELPPELELEDWAELELELELEEWLDSPPEVEEGTDWEELELDDETSSTYSVPWPGWAKTQLKHDKINIIVIKTAKYLYFIKITKKIKKDKDYYKNNL